MSENLSDMLSRIEQLSRDERAELAYAALRSLESGEDEGVDEAWDAELSRRVAEIRSGTAIGKPVIAEVQDTGSIARRSDIAETV